MKKGMMFFFMTVVMAVISTHSFAQRKKPAMPDEGYWVIESNVKTPKQNTVYFYSNGKQRIGQLEMNGKKINVARRKVVKTLNALLNQALIAFHQKESQKNDAMLAKQ